MTHLRIATSYPYVIKLQFNFDEFYETPNADKLYSHQSNYSGDIPYRIYKHISRAWEDAQRSAARLETLRENLDRTHISDYAVVKKENNRVDFCFRSDNDRMTAATILVPEETFEVDFMVYEDGTPQAIIEEHMAFIQNQYNQVDLETAQLTSPVKLRADFKNHVIKAKAKAIDVPFVLNHGEMFAQVLTQG